MSGNDGYLKRSVFRLYREMVEVVLTWATAWPLLLFIGSYTPDSWKTYALDNVVNGYWIAASITIACALYALRPFVGIIVGAFVAMMLKNGSVTKDNVNTIVMPSYSDLWLSADRGIALLFKLFVISQLLLFALEAQFENAALKNKVHSLEADVRLLMEQVVELDLPQQSEK